MAFRMPAELQAIMRDMERMSNEEAERRALADPVANKLTKVIKGGLQYRFYSGGKNGRGSIVRFCYSRLSRCDAEIQTGTNEMTTKPTGQQIALAEFADSCECAYCGGTIYGALVWVGDDDYCVGCFMERFAQDITELLQIVADICQPLPSVALAIAAE